MPVVAAAALFCAMGPGTIRPSDAAGPTAVAAVAGDTNDSTERRLLRDASDGTLDDFSLLEGALIANEVTSEGERERLVAMVDRAASEMAPRLERISMRSERSRILFQWMHERLLPGTYHADCTQLPRTLATGDYNCVSATILFHALCRRFDLEPIAVATPTHVFSRLSVEGETIDIQTTCPRWFELSEDQKIAASPGPGCEIREISDVELIAKVYYNHGVRSLESDRFERAESAFRKSLILDPGDATANENFLATLNNWALACCDRNEFEKAVQLLDRGLKLNADCAAFRANELHIHQRWAQDHCRRGDFQAALGVLSAGARRRPEEALFQDGPVAVYRMWAQSLEKSGQPDQAVQVIHRALRAYPGHRDLASDRDRLAAVGGTADRSSPRALVRDTLVRDTRSRADAAAGE